MTIGQTIRRRRKEVGISQADLARRVGMTGASLCRIERSAGRNLSVRTVHRLAKCLKMTITIPGR